MMPVSQSLDKPAQLNRQTLGVIFILFICALIIRVGPITRPLDAIDGRILPDDTYLSLEVAKNIGLGNGPLYEDNYTNGYQPLFVILASWFYTDFDAVDNNIEVLDKAVKQSILMVVGFDMISLLLLGLLLSSRFAWSIPTYVGMLIWALHPYVYRTALNGLETSMASMFLLLIVLLWSSYARGSNSLIIRFLLGNIIGLGVLSRIDMAILGFWILVFELNDVRLQRWTFRQASISLIATFLGFLIVYTPWVAWSYSYTQLLFPESGPAVRFQSLGRLNHELPFYFLPASLLAAFFWPIEFAPLLYLPAGVLLIAGWYLHRKSKVSWFTQIKGAFEQWGVIFAFAITLILVYGLYQYGWWFLERYLFITVLTTIFILAACSHYFVQRTEGIKKAIPLAFTLLACIMQPGFWKPMFAAIPQPGEGYRAVGIWANDFFPPGTVVGAMQTGGLCYYAPKLKILNLDGVVDKAAFTALETRDLDVYMNEKGMQYYLGWPVNTKYLIDYSHKGRYEYTDEGADFLKPIKQLPFMTWGQSWTLFKYLP